MVVFSQVDLQLERGQGDPLPVLQREEARQHRPLLPLHHVHHHLLHAVRIRVHGGRCRKVRILTVPNVTLFLNRSYYQ